MSAPGRTEQGRELSPLGITPNQALGCSDHSYGYPRQYPAKTEAGNGKRYSIFFTELGPDVSLQSYSRH
jgi:hypothetical protein